MARAWIALGANIGEPAKQIDKALDLLDAAEAVCVTNRSMMIVSAPWGKTDQPAFHNMVVQVDTALSPPELLETCLSIEKELGRVRREKWGPRLIDLDLIAYERTLMSSERLTLPHPYAHERDFVLEPLREIAPETADWIVKQAG